MMTVDAVEVTERPFVGLVHGSACCWGMSRLADEGAFTSGMGAETVSTKQAAELLGVSEQTVRNRIAANQIRGVVMVGGAWRIPLGSIRPAPTNDLPVSDQLEPPRYVQRLVERLDAFDTGLIRCAVAADIAGVGVKAMRNGLRSGRIPGGRLVGGCWLVSVVEFGSWLGVARAVV
jgi:excisionase family DNA binding protein